MYDVIVEFDLKPHQTGPRVVRHRVETFRAALDLIRDLYHCNEVDPAHAYIVDESRSAK